MCGSMVDIQSVTADIMRGKKRRKIEVTTGWKYNGLPYYIGRPWKVQPQIAYSSAKKVTFSVLTSWVGDRTGIGLRIANSNQQTTVRSVCVCALQCAQLLHTILHRTVVISDNFPARPPDNHHCSDDVCLRKEELENGYNKVEKNNWFLLLRNITRATQSREYLGQAIQ